MRARPDDIVPARPDPTVSIVVPTRNRRQLLKLTLTSALRQKGVEVEVIVVDDGSTDGTSEMVAALSEARVRLVNQEQPLGIGASRNRGILEARGDWIAFLDDDDLWSPEKLSGQLDAARESQRAWAYSGDVNVDSDLRVLSGAPPPPPEHVMETLHRYNSVPSGASNVVVRADVLAEAGHFDPDLRRIADWDMWIRLARIDPPACVPQPSVAYRFHPRNLVEETTTMVREPEVLAKRYGIRVDRAAMERWAAWSWLRAGRRGRALFHYGRAIATGDVSSVARALVAMVHPAVGSDRIFGLLRTRSASQRWRREAQAWLDELALAEP